MSFNQELALRLVDNLVFGTLLAVFAAYIQYRLAKFTSDIERKLEDAKQVMVVRIPIYKLLWAITEKVSPTVKVSLNQREKNEYEEQLRRWYYQEGNGIFLSLEVARLYLQAKALLVEDPDIEFAKVQEAFGLLRTKLKEDLGVYNKKDASTQIGR